jgi:hypothetical protein
MYLESLAFAETQCALACSSRATINKLITELTGLLTVTYSISMFLTTLQLFKYNIDASTSGALVRYFVGRK